MYKPSIVWKIRFSVFRKQWPIHAQIKHYAAWKGNKAPAASRQHEKELLSFVFHTKIRDVRDILLEDIVSYRDSISSDYFRGQIYNSLKQFFKFCKTMGYAHIQIECVNGFVKMEKIHHLLDLDNVLRVKALREKRINGKPMSYRKIKAYMEKRDKRVYDVHAIYRWANYQLPPDFKRA